MSVTKDPVRKVQEAFNAALDFALDGGADAEGLTFLQLWREGAWETIGAEFPAFQGRFDVNTASWI